jgi:hypothetical protein
MDWTGLPTEQGRGAIDLVLAGFYVFPAEPRGKRPLTANGFKDATTDPEVVARWWTRWPDANVAIACGASGVLVGDVDGADGARAWQALAQRHGPVRTLCASTGREAGAHIYFLQPADGIGNRRIADGLETRGRGGYVIAPPSIHAGGRRYRWTTPWPIAAAPPWLVDVLQPTPRPPRIPATGRALACGEVTRLGLARLRGVAHRLEATGEGNRHALLFWAACRAGELVAGGLVAEDVARAVLVEACMVNGLLEDDGAQLVERTIKDGFRASAAA